MSHSNPQTLRFFAASLVFIIGAYTSCTVAQSMDDVEITSHKAADNVYMLTGRGGNIGVCVGEDGVFMIDDQFAPLTEKILAEVKTLSDKPVQFLINTHWHGDHTGGNENLGEAGAIIVAHKNVRTRLSEEQFSEALNRTTPASPAKALPVITFDDSIDFHYNDEHIRVIHVPPAHTDGDSIICFTNANVVHTGDVFFNGMYPYIDVDSGGSIDGIINAANRVLKLADANTKIIPGHGPMGTVKDLRAYRDMLKTARDRIQTLIDQDNSREQIIAANPTKNLDEKWGGGFMQPDMWVGIVYDSLTEESS